MTTYQKTNAVADSTHEVIVAIDAEIDLCNSGDVYFLRAWLNVSLPGLEREVAQAIVGGSEVRADAEGFLTVTPKGIAEDFAQDLPDREKQLLTATQGPTALARIHQSRPPRGRPSHLDASLRATTALFLRSLRRPKRRR